MLCQDSVALGSLYTCLPWKPHDDCVRHLHTSKPPNKHKSHQDGGRPSAHHHALAAVEKWHSDVGREPLQYQNAPSLSPIGSDEHGRLHNLLELLLPHQ